MEQAAHHAVQPRADRGVADVTDDLTGGDTLADVERGTEDAGGGRSQEPIPGVPADFSGDAGVGERLAVADDAAERVTALGLDHRMRVAAGDEAGTQGDDGGRVGDASCPDSAWPRWRRREGKV